MNIKILGLLGILSVATVSYVSFADDTEVLVDDEEFEEAEEELEAEEKLEDEEEVEVEEVEVVTETRTVASRLSCDDVKQRVSELREDVKSHPELKTELETMLARQRTQCAPRANRRPVHNYENVNPVMVIDAVPVEEVVEEEVVEQVEEKPKEPVKTPEEIAAEEAVKKAEQERIIAENLANGLCGDGTKPNRYGCCEGEKFKETSHLQFACCPKEGDGECHEPIKKKTKEK